MPLFLYDQKDLIGQMEDESWKAAERSEAPHSWVGLHALTIVTPDILEV